MAQQHLAEPAPPTAAAREAPAALQCCLPSPGRANQPNTLIQRAGGSGGGLGRFVVHCKEGIHKASVVDGEDWGTKLTGVQNYYFPTIQRKPGILYLA